MVAPSGSETILLVDDEKMVRAVMSRSLRLCGYTVLDAAPTVEHIMPQKLSTEWQNALGPLWQQVHAEFLNTFGNLTLVTGEWNSSLSISPFPIKLK